MTVCQTNIYHLIALHNVDSNHTVGTWTGICLQTGLLHSTVLGSEYNVMVVDELCIIQSLQAEECIHLVIALDVEEVLDGTTLGIAVALRNLVTLQPVAAALLGKEQHGLVHGSRIDILGEVLITGTGTLRTYSTTSLLTEL